MIETILTEKPEITWTEVTEGLPRPQNLSLIVVRFFNKHDSIYIDYHTKGKWTIEIENKNAHVIKWSRLPLINA